EANRTYIALKSCKFMCFVSVETAIIMKVQGFASGTIASLPMSLPKPNSASPIVRLQSLRAIGFGAAVIVGGSLVMTTIIGLTAVTASLVRGDTPEMVI